MEGTPLSVEEADNQESRLKKELAEQAEREKKLKKPEKLGFFAVESEPEQAPPDFPPPPVEALPRRTEEERPIIPRPPLETPKVKAETPLTGMHVEALSQAELLDLASNIVVDGNSLRHAYETRMIGEHGLRRLVAEYERGGDMREALRREILEHQIDFERDPAMRDLAVQDPASDDAQEADGDTPPFLEKLFQGSEESEEDKPGDKPNEHARPFDDSDDSHAWRSHGGNRSKAALDALFVSVISILLLLVIFIYISRH